MCGLVGFLRANGHARDGDAAVLRAMTGEISHRGPDDEGVWLGEGVGLGHRRLSVVDTSSAGHQPMTRGRWTLVLNGEIYNYRHLREELERKGEVFTTRSDTEVLLVALAIWGADALGKLNGMFAFALWDSERRELLIARDRIGEKPFYYSHFKGDLAFGSEIKSVLKWPGLSRRPNLAAIHHYLSMQYVPSPLTAFEGIYSLPPGHMAVCRAGQVITPTRYWDIPSPNNAKYRNGDLAAELRDLLGQAVKRRLVADVPVGAFLSGGVDSSSVTALMALEAGRQIKTFSIGFANPKFDERSYARMVAHRYATDHHEEVIDEDATAILPKIVWHHGQPFADPSAIPTYYLSRLARRHVTVALSGDGGDEFFLGYDRYDVCRRLAWADQLPGPVRGLLGLGADAIPSALSDVKYFRTAKRLLRQWSSTRGRRYEPTIMYFLGADKESAYGDLMRPNLVNDSMSLLAPWLEAGPTLVEGAAYADQHSYLPDDILVKVDVASMAFGLEARAPLLDVELMEWVAALPASIKAPNGRLKGLLKDAVSPLLPPEIIDRRKMGFGVPIEQWLRGGFATYAREVLTSAEAEKRGLFRPEFTRQLLDEHTSGRRLHHTRIWAMLMLELWFVMWIDANGAKPI